MEQSIPAGGLPWAMDARVAQTIFHGAPGGVLVVDVNATCVAANEAMVELGLLSSRATNKPLADVGTGGVVHCVYDALEECTITSESHSAEHILVIDGKETWWLVTSSPVLDERGRLTHVVCVFFYIDFLKRTEEALRLSEETFRTLIERVPDAVVVADRVGVRWVNRAAVRLLGAAQAEDLIGAAPRSLLEPSDRGAVRDAWRSAVRGEGPRLVEARVVRADGGRATVDFIPIPTVFEGCACVLAVARDVTERNELHTRLAQADRSIALGTLAAGVAHQINNPLQAVQTNVSYVLERLEESGANEELRLALSEALDGVKLVAGTVRELRNLASGDLSSVANLDVSAILDQVLRLTKADVERKAKLVVHTSGPVGHVRASSLLGHVFLNLVHNALQAIPEGAPEEHELRFDVAPKDGGVLVRVADTGPGIAREHLSRIFDPFFTTKPLGEGLGLGLAIAQRILQVSGGRISAQSEPGEGATFEIWLPPAIPSK